MSGAIVGLICAVVLSTASGTPAAAATGGNGTSGSASAAQSAAPSADPTSGPKPGPGATTRPKAAPKGDTSPKRVNVKAGARPPVARKKATDGTACGGTLTFGVIYSCPSITGDRQDVFTVTTTTDDDTLYGTFIETQNNDVDDYAGAMVYDADGNYLCYYAFYPGTCQLGAAGTYTVIVALDWGVGDLAYTFSAQSLKTPSSCRRLGNSFFSFDSPGHAGDLEAGSAGDCYVFDQPAGTVLHLWTPRSTGDVRGEILDGNYQPVCPVQYDYQCTLTSAGPYHVMMYELYAHATTYTLRMARLSHSTGCPALRTASFGDPGDATGTASLPAQNDVACHKLRVPSAGGVDVRLYNEQLIWWDVYDDAGAQVCDKYTDAWSCYLPAGGAYTILTSNQDWNTITYQIAVTALASSRGCSRVTSLGWDQDAAVLSQTSAVQINCQQFQGAAGQRVVVYSGPSVYETLVDSGGRALCRDYSEENGCALPADGTYRAVTYLSQFTGGTAGPYKVQLRSLSTPTGCPVVTVGAFNAPPAGASGPIRCRTVRVDQPETLRIRAYDGENYQTYAAVYDLTGHRICDDSSYCAFAAAGDYTMVLDGQVSSSVIDNDFAYVTSVLPLQPAGCPVLSQDLYQGTFTDPGQYLCVQLPEPTGAVITEQVPAGTRYPFTYVMDSAGNYLCDSSYQLWQTSCTLTGTAPYLAVLSQQSGVAPAPVAAQFTRVDGPPSCPAFDGSTVTSSATAFVVCRSIVADAHSTTETFSWYQGTGTGGAYLSVFDANGTRYCGPTGTFTERKVICHLPAGPVTVLLVTSAESATFDFTHQPT